MAIELATSSIKITFRQMLLTEDEFLTSTQVDFINVKDRQVP